MGSMHLVIISVHYPQQCRDDAYWLLSFTSVPIGTLMLREVSRAAIVVAGAVAIAV